MVKKDDSLERRLTHDGVVHHPLGGGSYVFKRNYVEYLVRNISKDNLRISIGAQPNSSPHFGTLVVFTLAYALGQKISERRGTIKPELFFEVVDTGPSETREIEGIDYQISLRDSKLADSYLEEYFELLELLKGFSGIDYTVRRQREFNSQLGISGILRNIVQHKEIIAPILDPENGLLRMRAACPDCGLTDKKGVNTKYYEDRIKSYCPEHEWFETYFDGESEKFEYNTPLRNLIRGIIYTTDNQNTEVPFEWMRVTGNDYAGYYQEQLLYKAASLLGISAHELPTIVYAPLIVDWSGAKLSKSLYVKEGAYKDLPQYLVNYGEFRDKFGEEGMKKMFEEISSWLEQSYKLFRNYSVYYFMELFSKMTEQMEADFMEPKEIFLSIKPVFADLIAKRAKTYEFRRYKPHEPVKRIWLYITRPECVLKYIAEVGDVVEYPAQIPEDGTGNSDFNKGLKVSKFAFPILHLDELIEGMPLNTLRSQFHFNPPQGYIYTDTFPDLVAFVKGREMKRLY